MKGAFAYVPARFQEISGHGVRNSRIRPPPPRLRRPFLNVAGHHGLLAESELVVLKR